MFSTQLHRNIYVFALVAAPFGLLLGQFPGSLAVVIMGANWLLEGNFKSKWQRVTSMPLFYVMLSYFLLIVFGSLYGDNKQQALEEFRIALPLMAFPLVVMSSEAIGSKEVKWTLLGLIVGCVLNTIWCLLYAFVLHHVEEVRNLSRFMSHIRLGMFIDLAVLACGYLFYQTKVRRERVLYVITILYLLAMLFVLGLVSGMVMLLVVLLLAGLRFLFRQPIRWQVPVLALFVLLVYAFTKMFKQISIPQLQATESAYNAFKQSNGQGRPYICFDSLGKLENGNYVFRNIQMEDLRNSWNKRVPEDTFSYQPMHNLKRYDVLLRYLSSASLSKDAEGVKALSEKDIRNIQHNITNVDYVQWWFIHKRLYELVNEYADFKNKGDVNGHSFAMRWRFWQAAVSGFRSSPLFGVGTGDVQDYLSDIYVKHFPELDKKYYLKPHNQFLSVAVEFGLLGLLVFLWMLVYPVLALRKKLHALFAAFYVILLLSFITEDTLGTQAGVGFYAIFSTLFLAEAYFKKPQIPEDLQVNH